MRFHLIALVCAIILQRAFSAVFQLPADSDDAVRMLENGSLDSCIWQKIRPFYSIPLNVPSGDFLVLKRIFPEILKQLPSKQRISEKYSPWDEEQISCFFKDFPQLIEFEPILEFTGNYKKKGSLSISIINTLIEGAGPVHATINLQPSPWLTMRGRTDIWDEHARWSDRFISIQPLKSLSLQIGNIDWPDEYGLMSGRFSLSNSSDNRYNNWLYGDGLSWNGVCLGHTWSNFCGDQQLHSILYGHILKDDIQYALQSGFAFGLYHEIDSYFVINQDNNKSDNIYGGITYQLNTKKLGLNLAVGATSQNQRAFPFLAMMQYSYTIGQCNISLCHYNDTSGLQNSQKLHSNLMTLSEGQMFTKTTFIDITNKLHFTVFPSVSLRLTSTLFDFEPVNNTIQVSLDKEIECCTFSMLSKVNLSDTPEKCNFGGTLKYTGFRPLGITLKSNAQYCNNQFRLDQLEVLFNTAPMSSVKITPVFLLNQHVDNTTLSISGELRTVTTLWKGTTSQIRIKYPIRLNNFWEELHVDCKASFIF